jgi:hypothetical protein
MLASHRSRTRLAFLTPFFALLVFLIDGFFTVAAFLDVTGAFFEVVADFLAVVAFSAGALVLLAVAFFAEAGLDDSTAFFVEVPLLDGGLVFYDRLSNIQRKKVR